MSSYGTYLSASAVRANVDRIDVVSNNLANVESGGFKRLLAGTIQRPIESRRTLSPRDRHPPADGIGGGVMTGPTRLDLSQGALETTGNPLDVALVGEGFFAVQTAAGDVRLTRDGRFMTDADGRLVTQSGHRVLDDTGRPVTVGVVAASKINVADDGVISVADQPVGRIGVFATPAAPTPVGGNLYDAGIADAGTLAPGPAVLRARALERSNVDPTVELTRLLDAQRQLEANAGFIKYQDAATDKLVNVVGKVA